MEELQQDTMEIEKFDSKNEYENMTDIQKFYAGTTILLTGASGFLGKIVLEKLLRSCDVETIYLLMREKKGQDPEERLDNIFNKPIFEKLKQVKPNYRKKVEVINGDCSLPELGINNFDKETIINKVNCVFHVAASINFDPTIESATYVNVRAVRDILRLTKEIQHLKSFVYVSTAYSNCTNKDIPEKFFDPPIEGKELISLVETKNDEKLKELIRSFKKEKWPNLYVVTKSVAESIIKDEGKGLPACIVRPSIIISTAREPVPGWTDSLYGPTGFLTGVALGVIHTMQIGPNKIGDIVPADYVVNTIIASGWDVGKKEKTEKCLAIEEAEAEDKTEKEVQIYNYVSGAENPIVWDTYAKLGRKHGTRFASSLAIWYPFFTMTPNRVTNLLAVLFYHLIPAVFIDSFAWMLGKSPTMLKTYKKIHRFQSKIAYFLTRQWNFSNDNTQRLWEKMKGDDQKEFELSMKLINWDTYFHTYVMGARIYLLKDPLHTIEIGYKKWRKLYILHIIMVILLLYFCYKFGQLMLYMFYFE